MSMCFVLGLAPNRSVKEFAEKLSLWSQIHVNRSPRKSKLISFHPCAEIRFSHAQRCQALKCGSPIQSGSFLRLGRQRNRCPRRLVLSTCSCLRNCVQAKSQLSESRLHHQGRGKWTTVRGGSGWEAKTLLREGSKTHSLQTSQQRNPPPHSKPRRRCSIPADLSQQRPGQQRAYLQCAQCGRDRPHTSGIRRT